MIADMSARRLAAQTITGTVSAVRRHYGFLKGATNNWTTAPLVADAICAAKKNAPPVKRRSPLTRDILVGLAKKVNDSDWMQVRDFFMILLGYRAYLRSSEIVSLTSADLWLEALDPNELVSMEDRKRSLGRPAPPKRLSIQEAWPDGLVHNLADYPDLQDAFFEQQHGVPPFPATGTLPDGRVVYLFVRIRSSKTNQQAQKDPDEQVGEIVVIGGDAFPPLSPLKWYVRAEAARSNRGPKAPFFQCMLNHQRSRNGTALTPAVNSIVKKETEGLELPNELSLGGHSMRSGGATDAIRARVDLRVVKKHGRWRSNAVYLYVRESVADFHLLNARMGHYGKKKYISGCG